MGGMATGENSNGSGATYDSLKNRKIDKVSMDGTSGNLNFSKPQNLLTQKIDMNETIENTVSTPLNGSEDFSNISQNNYKNKKDTKLDFSSMYTSDEDDTAFSDELHSTDSDLDIQNKTYGEMKAQERKAQQEAELKAHKTQQRIEDKALTEKQKLEVQQVKQQVQKSRQSQSHPTVSAEAQRENESLANHLVNESSETSGLNSLYEKMYQDNPVEAEANLQNLIQLTSHKDQQTGQKLARDMRSVRSKYSDFRVKEQTANYKDDILTSNNSSNHSIPENKNKLENTHTFIFTDDRAQILSQTDERIDPIGFYNEVKFDPSGMGRNSYALFNLIDAQKISTTADEA
ncbi:hypothetical protein [Curvivirga aplysinae]|uniref:hypothetical protein n=1 Tax=Curvivirga aplysinae TaxID=2529852 RepID=UPI0012BCA752|nr:hypothetical protein [Curvivirga aplysinae]MTI09096.1 hypothetical protein [Curvivirga aplysinae]